MTVFLIRHGMTKGNLERRYIGASDEPLCEEGRNGLLAICPPEADRLIVSPMLRCRETAGILYPGMEQTVAAGLRETDFGVFEGHTYEELKNVPAYQAWLDSGRRVPPPGGESMEAVRERVARGFLDAVSRCDERDRIALIIHGGTIMTLLEMFEDSHRFYDWQVTNGGGWRCEWNGSRFTNVEKLMENK